MKIFKVIISGMGIGSIAILTTFALLKYTEGDIGKLSMYVAYAALAGALFSGWGLIENIRGDNKQSIRIALYSCGAFATVCITASLVSAFH